MRSIAGCFVFILAAAACGSEARAQYDPYPWCAEYSGGIDGAKNCYFLTLQQCRTTVSGVGGYCTPNTFYTGPAADRPAPRRARPRS